MPMLQRLLLVVAAVQLGPMRTAFAEELTPPAPSGTWELEGSLVRDGTVTAVAAVAWISTETFFKSALSPRTCRWCDNAPDGSSSLNPVDGWGRGIRARSASGQHRADVASSVIDYAALPLALVGTEAWVLSAHQATRRAWEDALDVGEAVALAGVLDQAVKFAAGRERPFVHALPASDKAFTAQPSDNNLSFYSGHSTVAFSLVVAAGTVATLRGYEGAGWIWGVGLPLATAVPVLRMVADKHYLSDVVVGTLLGAGIGVAVPVLLHRRKGATPLLNARLGVGPDGITLTWVG